MQFINHVPEGWKIYELSDGRKYVARKNSCLFCSHCSDIFYDYTNGIYMLICDIEKNIEKGMSGKCKDFKEVK